MAADADENGFLDRAKELSTIIKDHVKSDSSFMVISHHDADGLSSAGIMGSALARAKTRFSVRIVEELREDIVDEINKTDSGIMIFTDIGSGYFELLSTIKAETILVLDHHPPTGEPPKKVAQLNPHEFRIDGARLVSAAGVSYFVPERSPPKTKTSAPWQSWARWVTCRTRMRSEL